MGFADRYFERFFSFDTKLNCIKDFNPGIAVVIPVFNEPKLTITLNCLKNCIIPDSAVIVIIVVNHSDRADENEKVQNLLSIKEVELFSKQYNCDKLRFQAFELFDLPEKSSSVGTARKAGMDEAIRIFNHNNRHDGVIVSLDADCLVDEKYFVSIENFFNKKNEAEAATISFAHPLSGTEFSREIYEAVCFYELHLRYFRLGLQYTGYPYPIHTIGSCFAVRALTYVKAGGMNRRKGGEDFYFLHKLTDQTNIPQIDGTCVVPSPRFSTRVPFGTGPAVQRIVELGEYLTYDVVLFEHLKKLFGIFTTGTTLEDIEIENDIKHIDIGLYHFCKDLNLLEKMQEVRKNTSTHESFVKRMFQYFDAFCIIKYLNNQSKNAYPHKPVVAEAIELLSRTGVLNFPNTPKNLLLFYREMERSH